MESVFGDWITTVLVTVPSNDLVGQSKLLSAIS
jgi:hypothetical protein